MKLVIGRVKKVNQRETLVELPKYKGRNSVVNCKRTGDLGLRGGFRVAIDIHKIRRNQQIPFVYPGGYTAIDQTSSWQYGFIINETDRSGNLIAVPGRGGNPIVLRNSRSDLDFQESTERIKFSYTSRGHSVSFSDSYHASVPTPKDDSRLELMLDCSLNQKLNQQYDTLILYDKKHSSKNNTQSLIVLSKSSRTIRNTIDALANDSFDPVEVASCFSAGIFVEQYDLAIGRGSTMPESTIATPVNFLLANEVYKKDDARLLKLCGRAGNIYVSK